ncbi:MAG TPA: histidinol-phosphatase [Ignavibacteriaceae bacterium]|jgi:myo-inositol-1(or 4)-monophosphatase|nr:MAG: Histidinol-phosphatase [Ignavibacteria bacterium ADurb.Bin266]OQY72426.1 MAG: histidinol-phosphatase [Ignavibacteriales bacterium UTCHB2]HQF43864.1 histidinol-phosphatase [Ignavibacteriaceae bacterium]HQI39706.1 histidinol-phosphatase [Ignavibacteriaceae bacterium]
MEIRELQSFLKLLADESSAIIRQYYRTDLKIENKQDESPVTIADRMAEEKMRLLIQKEFPNHGIIGEEFGSENTDAEFVWVLDPIDGTKSFISGALSFGTLIALLKNGEPFIGVINHPILKEFLVGDNNSAWLNNNLIRMRVCNSISEATLLTTDHFNIGKYHNQIKFDNLAKRVKLYRNWGDCYGYYLLATGYADIMIDPIMSVWDSMAVIPIIKGAGGEVTDYNGNNPVTGNSIVACNKKIHSEVIKLLNN